MIRAGRSVVGVAELAELHGLTERQARRARPWAEPGHPAPVSRGRAARGNPALWDAEQARAYAAGAPVPPLPEPGAPGDLLDRVDAAELAGVAASAWRADSYRDRVPAPDAHPHGVPHWRRDTVTAYRQARAAGPRTGGGRPAERPDTVPRAELAAAIADLVDAEPGISVAEIARRTGVAYSTAHRHAHAARNH